MRLLSQKRIIMDNKIKNEKNIKATVLISYAVIVLLIGSIVYFTFTSFQKLTQNSDALAQPNARVVMLHDIVYSLYKAESHIRAYTLTEDQVHLDSYLEEFIRINVRIDSLNSLAADDTFFLQIIDSINVQLLSKTQLLEQYVQLKQQDYNTDFYSKVIDEIIQVTEKETRVKEITHQSILSQIPPYAINPVQEVQHPRLDYTPEEIKQEKINFITRLRSLFSNHQTSPFTLEFSNDDEIKAVEYYPENHVRTDSIITFYRDTEELKEDIEKKLAGLMQTILENQRNLQIMENRLLMEDKTIMDRIWRHINILQDYESYTALREAEKAHATVNTTTEKIFATVVFSLLFLLIFSWLLINDVNKSRFYKKQLILQKLQAEQLVQVKQRFMANLSHEIRTPLNSIIGFSNQLGKAKLERESQTFVNAINQSSVHLRGIVNDMLDFSKIEAGKIELEVIPVDIKEIIEEVYTTLSIIARDKNLEFSRDTNALRNPMVLGDPLRIKQILLNITGNALKFTKKGKVEIIVSDYQKKENPGLNYVEIKVADTGIGIPENKHKTIFEEFAQADTMATRKHAGTGLGLSISKKLVELMDGHIKLFSQENQGSTFSIHLPLEITQITEKEDEKEQMALDQNASAKILLIDDDNLNRLLFRTLFSAMKNFKFFEAGSPKKGIQMLNEQKFDLIITDIQMPDISGVDLVRQIRSDAISVNNKTRILACTADTTPETLKLIKQNGVDDYLLKPVDENLLLRKIHKLLSSKKPYYDIKHPIITLETNQGNTQKPYDLEGLIAFTGKDQTAIRQVISVFINDTRVNLENLEKNLQLDNRDNIFAIVHKMDNMLGLLKATSCLVHLKKINEMKASNGDFDKKEFSSSVTSVIKTGEQIIHLLEEDLREIEKGLL
jgi:signal transduction histidine kinase/CheY-like chemotaxis protein